MLLTVFKLGKQQYRTSLIPCLFTLVPARQHVCALSFFWGSCVRYYVPLYIQVSQWVSSTNTYPFQRWWIHRVGSILLWRKVENLIARSTFSTLGSSSTPTSQGSSSTSLGYDAEVASRGHLPALALAAFLKLNSSRIVRRSLSLTLYPTSVNPYLSACNL